MNQPTEDRIRKIEERLDKLEESQKVSVEADHLQHQQTQLLRLDVQETNILLKRVQLDIGTSRERLDTLERGQQGLLQELHTISNTWLESLQENVDEIKAEILTVQGTQNERFDRIETTQAEHGQRFDRIETTQAEHGQLLGEHTKRFDRLETIMMQILDRLPRPEGK